MEIIRTWRWHDTLMTLCRNGYYLLGLFWLMSKRDVLVHYESTLVLYLFTVIVPHLFWRPGYIHRRYYTWAEMVLNGALYLTILFWASAESNSMVMSMVTLGFFAPPHLRVWVVLSLVVLVPLAGCLFGALSVFNFSQQMMMLFLCFYYGYSFRRSIDAQEKSNQLLEENRRQYLQIEEQNAALVLYAKEVERMTLIEERNRMARELHDTVGHTFTSVIMGMDAVHYLLETQPEKAREKLDVLREVMRSGLDEVRRNIHEIAPDDENEPVELQLKRLASEFAQHTGTKVQVSTVGSEPELSAQMKLTLVRCLQETLTNAKRHGQATTVDCRLSFERGQLRLMVHDDGIGQQEVQPGFGLRAMRERLSSLSGTLYVSSAIGHGTTVTCTVPVVAPGVGGGSKE